MKLERGAGEREFILQFESLEEFEAFFQKAEQTGSFELESATQLPPDSTFIARAHGSPRSRKIKPSQIVRENARHSVRLKKQTATPQVPYMLEPKAEKQTNLHDKIHALPLTERVALAMKADLLERRILMQENNMKIHEFLLRNPRITEPEIAWMARNATSPMHTILTIYQNKSWMAIESIRTGILTNPKTPPAIVMDLIPLLSAGDLIKMFHSRLLREDVQTAIHREVKKRGIRIKKGSNSAD